MSRLTVIIERSENNFSAYIKGVDGIAATGRTVDEIKQSICEAIAEFVSSCKDLGREVPEEISGSPEITFEIDIQSLLTIYEGIFTKSGLERLTGINQKQLWHYAKGKSRPRQEQRRKLESALHRLGSELLSLSFS